MAEQNAIHNFGNGIMKGKAVQNGEPLASSIVGIYNVKERAVCTGSLIADDIVMTAAHCMGGRASDLRIIFWNDIDEMMAAHEPDVKAAHVFTATDYKANSIWNPNDFEKTQDRGDIALVKFRGKIPEGYKPATFLADGADLVRGNLVTVAGYGVDTVETTPVNAKKYKNLENAIENGEVFCDDQQSSCFEINMSGDGILRHVQAPISMVVATEVFLDEKNGGTCSGDSGGPAYIEKNGQYYLFGITSRGTAFCDDAGVYTNALTYKQWIQDTIKTLK